MQATGDTDTALRRLLAGHRLPVGPVDLPRLRRQRHARLQSEMARQDVDAAVLLHAPHVGYATGQVGRGVDVTVAAFERPVAVVVAGEPRPHLFGGAPDGLDVDAHPAVWPELDEGVERLAARWPRWSARRPGAGSRSTSRRAPWCGRAFSTAPTSSTPPTSSARPS